jgi:L-rhamnose-H+ transport protein
MPVAPNPFLGIGLHAVGATCASTCYTPQKKVQGWSWQTYWITQASFCWLILPILGAWLTIPHILDVISQAPKSAMLWSFLLGMLYGIGGTAFGLAIRHIGFSLTYAIAVGISSVLGTLAGPLLKGDLASVINKPGSGWVITGVVISTLGIALVGWAGRSKENDLEGAAKQQFSLSKGLTIAILAGVLSAVYGFSLEAANPIAEIADRMGAGEFNGNIKYVFANPGAFVTTAIYCLYLTARHKTAGEFVALPAADDNSPRGPGTLPINFLMAFLTGCLWYGQFFFYGLGHVRMGDFEVISWTIHMTMLVFISNAVGFLLKEWSSVRPSTRTRLYFSLSVLLLAISLMTIGNVISDKASKQPPSAPADTPAPTPQQ